MFHTFRFVILVLSTICLTLIYSLRLAFHFTIISQRNSSDPDNYLENKTLTSLSYAAVSFGLIIGLIPLSLLNSWGTRKLFVTFGSVGIVSTFLYPTADEFGFFPAFVIRLLQGLPGAVYLWAINSITMEWAPNEERGIYIAILTCFYQLAPVTAYGAGALFSDNWPMVYYVLSMVTLIFFVAFWLLYTNDPHDNRFTTKAEAKMITEGHIGGLKQLKVPYGHILKDPQVYLAWYMYLSFFVGAYVWLQYGPSYINQVLNFGISLTGFWSILPHGIAVILKFVYGTILDKFFNFSPRARLIFVYASAETISALALFSLLITSSKAYALFVYVLFNSLHSVVVVVVLRHMQSIAKQYAFVLVNGNTVIVAGTVALTSLLSFLDKNSQQQWTMVFAAVAASIVVSVLLYSFCSSDKPRKWTEMEIIEQNDVEMK